MSRFWKQAARWLPALAWYGVIWYFSAQTGVQSSQLSDGVLENVFSLDIPNTPMALTALLSFLVRKAGHMFIFFVQTGLGWWALEGLVKKPRLRGAAALAVTGALAALDEFHQTFVPGRSGLPRDVVIDLLGGGCFLLALWLWGKWKRHRARKKADA